jgi:hypothetical protein
MNLLMDEIKIDHLYDCIAMVGYDKAIYIVELI